MTQLYSTYPLARRGKATSFTESEQPPEFAQEIRNRFINQAGGLEKRAGLVKLGAALAGNPFVTGQHELVQKDGTEILMATGNNGTIHKFDTTTSAWVQVHSVAETSARFISAQFGDRLIFVNGTSRNFYTEDASAFPELRSTIEKGKGNSETGPNTLHDDDVSNWVDGTDVVTNDLVFYPDSSAYAFITEVTASGIKHTAVSASSTGFGVGTAPSTNSPYTIIDMVELNVIATANTTEPDNVATLASSNSTLIQVSSIPDWRATDVRVGDAIRNTTRARGTFITAVGTSALTVTELSGQTTGDTINLFKSAMPISDWVHTHFNRLYHIDSRDKRKIRISGANDPEDMTSDAGTLESVSLFFGDQQPQGDILLSLGTFQQFFVALGEHNVLMFKGTVPIGTGADFTPVATFPQGVVSRWARQTTGNDFVFLSPDGLQATTQVQDETTLARDGITFAINKTLRDEIAAANPDDMILTHYRKRSWLLLKVGDVIHCYNYQTILGEDQNRTVFGGTVTDFDGLFANQFSFFERKNGDLVCGGANGQVYLFDQDTFDDDGQQYDTEYRSAWLRMTEPKKDIRIKSGKYIKPLIEAGGAVTYTFKAEADFDIDSSDTAVVEVSGLANVIGVVTIPFAIGGSGVVNTKFPLRWNGERVRLSFTTDDTIGPDIVGSFTLYGNVKGAE